VTENAIVGFAPLDNIRKTQGTFRFIVVRQQPAKQTQDPYFEPSLSLSFASTTSVTRNKWELQNKAYIYLLIISTELW